MVGEVKRSHIATITRPGFIGYGVPLNMSRIRPECIDLDHSVAADVLLRKEPDDEEEEEDDGKEKDDDDNEGDDEGYSE